MNRIVNVYAQQGIQVPDHKKLRATQEVRAMMPDADEDLVKYIVNRACHLIEKDMLFAVLEDVAGLDEGLAKLDLTGRYRLAASILAP